MPLQLDQQTYFTASEVTRELGISRQTLWRWRQEGLAPPGHRFRDRQVVFTAEEFRTLKDYANRLEPAAPMDTGQLGLFTPPKQRRNGSDGGENA